MNVVFSIKPRSDKVAVPAADADGGGGGGISGRGAKEGTSKGEAAGFPAALTQNVATGCTVMLNRPAARLVAASRPSTGTLHDWWAYLLVTAAGGRLVQDEEPVVLYRQHAQNLVGAPASMVSRAIAALRRGGRVIDGRIDVTNNVIAELGRQVGDLLKANMILRDNLAR